MSESEVEPLTSLVSRGIHIVQLLLQTHSVPNLVSLFVAPYIVHFGENIKEDVENTDTD